MKKRYLALVVIFIASCFIGFPACTKHEISLKSPDPIVIKLEARLDIYNHASEIEDMVSGDQPVKEIEEVTEEDTDENLDGSWLKKFQFCSSAWAEPIQPENAAIKSRKARYPRIEELKARGLLGENHQGYLDPRGQISPEVKNLLQAENQDRRIIYQSLAEKQKAGIRQIEASFAQVQRDRSRPGEWIQVLKEGKWIWVKK
ncbi:MAG: YdbL family protein [Candidatus Auribacterota bacterium]|nr:YdbL family protein [Candidatus Auribacterota bacterium]